VAGCGGPTAAGAGAGEAPAATDNEPSYAPYVDLNSPHPALADALAASGQRRYVLSFALSDGGSCRASWGGTLAVDDPGVRAQVLALRAAGGAVTAATGGEQGTYLEQSCPDATALAAAYRSVLDASGADRLDLDIEHPVPAELVADAVAQTRRDTGVAITVTVPVADADSGLDPAERPVLQALAARGVDVTVDALLMDYPAHGDWGASLLAAAATVAGQVTGPHERLGLTLMAGRNDTGSTTTLDDARAVLAFAREHDAASLGLWSLARDNGGCPGRATPSEDCSGIAQDPYAFTGVLSGARP
jgi:chitinase